jgi:hypothetical protein
MYHFERFKKRVTDFSQNNVEIPTFFCGYTVTQKTENRAFILWGHTRRKWEKLGVL